MSAFTVTNTKQRLSIKAQVLATLCAIVSAVALPQIIHWLGRVSGLGTLPGEVFLPMHLPIMLVGLLAGPYAASVAGLLGPAVSFALSGMPTAATLPFMMIELCAYGLVAGLLRICRMPTTLKVLIVQLAGRGARAVAVLLAVYAFSNTAVSPTSIYTSIVTGLFGMILQLVLLPLICHRVEHMMQHER
ncbi:MAG: ECF transporter S component [Ruminococcaceae bacterium]|nr:ECF transporter S component [Oscillospiraceae bacterium]